MNADLIERWSMKVNRSGPVPSSRPDLGPCWLWTASIAPTGYGRLRMPNPVGVLYAHRVAYELFVGPIPDGLEIDHLCCVRACVNPSHLEAVTHAENVRRGTAPTMAVHLTGSCSRGHARAEHGYARRDRPGTFNCNECRRLLRANP